MTEGFSETLPGSDFPPATPEAWLEKARASLKGRDPSTLATETLEGIRIEPVYAAHAGDRTPLPLPPRPAPLIRGRGWAVMQRLDLPEAEALSGQLAEELAMGADGAVFVLAGSPHAGAHGLEVSSLDAAIADADLAFLPLRLDAGFLWPEAARRLLDIFEARHLDPSLAPLLLCADPVSPFLAQGCLPPREALVHALGQLIERARAAGLRRAVLAADARPWHAAGCGEAQELALMLAISAEIMRLAEKAGLAPEESAPLISWLMVADADQFLTIAKLRAARLTHARLLEVLDIPFFPLLLQAESAWRMMTRRDPWVNLLRTASAAFGAGLGGADAITLLPFTHALGAADGFARRMARNMQIIAQEEAGLHRVADPLAGSAWVEAATRALAERAWEIFTGIEARGGLISALLEGHVQAMISDIAARRRQLVATRRIPITGVSEYPALEEEMPEVARMAPVPAPAVEDHWPPGPTFTPLAGERLAVPFERLRDAADLHMRATGRRPAVYLAQLGSVAGHGTRSSWAMNLLAAGGIAAVEGPPDDYEAARHGPVVVIAGSDALYEQEGAAIISALRMKGADMICAVASGEAAERLAAAGADETLAPGLDVPAFLRRLHERLGIGER
jgi:methylmalonyl-CoA mutase